MAKFELKLPKMGESVAEATITSWLKEVGDKIELDEPVLEIATDKVDSEVPSEVEGILIEKRFETDQVAKVGEVLAVIEIPDEEGKLENSIPKEDSKTTADTFEKAEQALSYESKGKEILDTPAVSSEGRFYSPLVRNIAKQEGISQQELDALAGTGKEGRVTKNDLLAYLEKGRQKIPVTPPVLPKETSKENTSKEVPPPVLSAGDEIIELSRMGKLIRDHMRSSLDSAAHVQSFVEADVTELFNWRARVKDSFEKREGQKLTFTPIFIEAVVKALKDFPLMNIQLQGDSVIKLKNIHIGMATALDDGNLIVPVIRNADKLNLTGIALAVIDLADRARKNQLKPDDIKGGTYTVTNVGNFGSIMGTPIINLPQVGILALGAIRKVPAVIETSKGDFIGIRMKMFLSHSYDHRVVNGALGGMFVRRVADYLEAWDPNREI